MTHRSVVSWIKAVMLCIVVVLLCFIADRGWHLAFLDFYIANRESPYGEVGVALALVLFISSLCVAVPRGQRLSYKPVILAVFASVAISFLVGGVLVYRQPVSSLPKTLCWFSGLTVYFALMRLAPDLATARVLLRAIVVYGFAASLFLVAAAVSAPVRSLIREGFVGERFGAVRINLVADLAVALAFVHFLGRLLMYDARDQMQRRGGRTGILLGFVVCGSALVLVNMTRQTIVSMVILFTATAFIARACKFINMRLVTSLLVGTLAIPSVVMLADTDGTSSVGQFVSSLDPNSGQAGSQNIQVRLQAIEFYWHEFLSTWTFGIGWISTTDPTSQNTIVEALTERGLLLADIGLFAVVFQYGLLGLLAWVLFVRMSMSQVVRLLLRSNDPQDRELAYTVGGFLLMQIACLSHLVFWPGLGVFYGIFMYLLDSACPMASACRPLAPGSMVRDHRRRVSSPSDASVKYYRVPGVTRRNAHL